MKGALLNGHSIGFTSGYFLNMLKRAASPTILEQISAKDSLASQYAKKNYSHSVVQFVKITLVLTFFILKYARVFCVQY